MNTLISHFVQIPRCGRVYMYVLNYQSVNAKEPGGSQV